LVMILRVKSIINRESVRISDILMTQLLEKVIKERKIRKLVIFLS